MRKKFSVLSMMLIMCVVTIPSAAVAGKKITLTQWLHSNPAWVTASETLAKQFERENPDVHISVEPFPYDTLHDKILVSMAAGLMPDVLEVWGTHVPEYIKADQLASLTPSVLIPDEMRRNFYEAAFGGAVVGEKIYAVPREVCIDTGFVLNSSMFREAGLNRRFKDWDELIAAGQKLVKHDAKGNLTRIALAFIGNPQIFMLGGLEFIKQLGGKIWLEDGKHMNFTSPEAMKALGLVTDLVTKYHLSLPEFEGERFIIETFFSGQAAMMWVGPWAVATGLHDYPEVELDYTMGPSLSDRPRYTIVESAGGWCLVVPKAAKQKEEAFRFIKFWATSKENLRTWNLLTGTVPSARALENDPVLVEKYPYLPEVFGAMNNLFWAGPMQSRERVSDTIERHLIKVMYGDTTVEKVAPMIEKEVNTMIDEYLYYE